MAISQLTLATTSQKRGRTLGLEAAVALAGTAFSAILLTETALHAGPLWRDEVNTFNVANMASMKGLWNNLPFESFPPLWPLLLRVCGFFGLTNSDMKIRLLGLCVGLLFLGSLWVCSRWMGASAPTISIALLGSLPAMIFILGANRAYGLASCLLVLSFGTLWRALELPTRSGFALAGGVCLLFSQCVYYDGIFLFAMLAAASLVAVRRHQWRTVWAMLGIGVACAASMAVYLPVIRRASPAVPMIQEPLFRPEAVWLGLRHAVSAWTSGDPGTRGDFRIWVWVGLVLTASILTLAIQWASGRRGRAQGGVSERVPVADPRADLALFCLVTALLGTGMLLWVLVKLRYFPQNWYYIEMLALWAIALDGILTANWPELVPWGAFRAAFLVLIMLASAGAALREAHTRRSNVDLVAAIVGREASDGDLVVLQDAWEGITFSRYYSGRAHWTTVPPIDSHRVHRNDLVLREVKQAHVMSTTIEEANRVLRSGHTVWVVGSLPIARPRRPLQLPAASASPTKLWLGAYLYVWNAQVSVDLLDHARQGRPEPIPARGPVSQFEDVSLVRFWGYQ